VLPSQQAVVVARRTGMYIEQGTLIAENKLILAELNRNP
jgi:hypothetical protein